MDLKRFSRSISTIVMYISFYKLFIDIAFLFTFSIYNNYPDLQFAAKVGIAIGMCACMNVAIMLNFKFEKDRNIAHDNINIVLGIDDSIAVIFQWFLSIFFANKDVDNLLIVFFGIFGFLTFILIGVLAERHAKS